MRSGLTCEIYKSKFGSSSLGGISETNDEVLLVLPEGGPVDEEGAKKRGIPMVKMVERRICGTIYRHLEPVEEGMWAAGGCFVKTSDSRFPSPYPLSLHDRDMRKER